MPMTPQPASQPTVAAPGPSPFPDAPRVMYERNPLVEVICQVRFPPVLKIETQLPDAFQERIREMFPVYNESSGPFGNIELPPEFLQLVRNAMPASLQKGPGAFTTEDGKWTVTLAKDFLALSTKEYKKWDDFRGHLEPALSALQAVYSPAFYTRTGLRYRDVIRRSKLGLQGEQWRDLLGHELSGELRDAQVADCVTEIATQTLIRLPEYDAKVRLQHGLTTEDGETCYVIDHDLFTERKTEDQNVFTTLRFFNIQAHRLFRWCITDRLHNAMGPQLLPPKDPPE
jgi:uncharacterized protein (TIGR04255 family)